MNLNKSTDETSILKKQSSINKIANILKRDYQLYLLALPAIIYFIVFQYAPMYGVQIAFKNFIAAKGIWDSPWIGFDNFERFFKSYYFLRLLKNTLGISLYQLIAGFPIPVILALLLNQTRNKHYKKIVQTVIYAPHFISVVVICGMLLLFLSPRSGIINTLIGLVGVQPINFLGEASMFKTIYVLSGIWQNAGWGTIIYLATLSSVDPQLYEAARVDGAGKFKTLIHIDIPSIIPVAIIQLILAMGSIMGVGFQKAFLLQNPLNIKSSEIIATYVYKIGLLQSQYSYSAAISLFNNIINIILLISINKIAQKFSETSLW